MRRILSVLFMVLFIASFAVVLTPDKASAAGFKTVKFKLTSTSGVDWAKLSINGASKGMVRKKGYTSVRLLAGKTYKIVAQRTIGSLLYKREKSLVLSTTGNPKKTVFLHVAKKADSSSSTNLVSKKKYKLVKFKLTSSSKVSRAKLYINGSYKGQVSKKSYKTIKLRAGKTYKIVAKGKLGSSNYERSKSLLIASNGAAVKTTFLHVAKKVSPIVAIDSDDNSNRKKYKLVKFKLTSSSKVSRAKLYINGSYKGQVSKNSYKTIKLLAGKTYKIVAKGKRGSSNYERSKSLLIASNGAAVKTTFLHVAKKVSSTVAVDSDDNSNRKNYKIVNFKLASSSKVRSAKLYINSSYKGLVSKNSYKKIKLRSGKTYQIAAIGKRGRNSYERLEPLHIAKSRASSTVILLQVSRKSSSSYSDKKSGSDSDLDGDSARKSKKLNKTLKFKLTSSSKVSWAKLYVNGAYKGRVSKNSYKKIRLRFGKTYKVVAKRKIGRSNYERNKTFVLTRKNANMTVFLHVSRKASSSYSDNDSDSDYDSNSDGVNRRRYKTVKFKLTSSSKVRRAKLYINGSYKGLVRKNSYKRIKLRTGKTYRIVAKRKMGRRNYERKKTLVLTRNSANKTVFLHVARKSGRSYSDRDNRRVDSDRDDNRSGRRYKSVKFKLTSSSKVRRAKLYINGSYKGLVSKNSYKRIKLRVGKTYKVVAKGKRGRRNYVRRKSLHIARSRAAAKTVFLHVAKRVRRGNSESDDEPVVTSRKRTVKFKLTSSTKPAWGKLYVNGAYKGRVTRNSYKRLSLRAGRTYRINVKRTYRGRRYNRNKTLRVKRGSGSQICFLHMSAR